MSDQAILTRSHAGMRFIALSTLYNRGDFSRIRAYLREHFTAAALEQTPGVLRLTELRDHYAQVGRVRLKQIIAYDEHHIVVLLESERGSMLIEDMTVEADYPHKISGHTRQIVD